MKKWLVLFLVLSMSLTLLACGGKKESFETKESKQQETEEVYFDAVEGCSMVINISVNPEIAMYLDPMGNVLEVKALNHDAEKVLKELDFSSTWYDVAVQMILLTLRDQGYAGNGQTVQITPYAKDDFPADTEQIVKNINAAVQTIEKDQQISFHCTVNAVKVVKPAGSGSVTPTSPTTMPAAPTTAINVDDGYDEVERDAEGNMIRTLKTMDDGTRWEAFYDKDGQITQDKFEKPDGRVEENFYQNGVFAKTLITEPFGLTVEMIYDANGLQKETYQNADGSGQEYEYQNNQLVREYRKEIDGSFLERFYQDDQLVKEVSKDAVGNSSESVYQIINGQSLRIRETGVWEGTSYTMDFKYDAAGELTEMHRTGSDGEWSNEYYQNGVLRRAERKWGASFITYLYDAEGFRVSGNGTSDTMILEETFYPGKNTLAVRTIKHLYDTFNTTKEYFDENENWIRTEVYDPNGNLIKTNHP